MADATAGISRSGRVRKKSAKLKEMEDVDIPDFELQMKSRKKLKGFDDSDCEMDDKKVAPIKIPKISFNLSSPIKKKPVEVLHTASKIITYANSNKNRPEKSPVYQEPIAEMSKGSVSSSASSESSSPSSSTSSSSSSSSDESDAEQPDTGPDISDCEMKSPIPTSIQRQPPQEVKSARDPYTEFHSDSYVETNSDVATYGSEGDTSESALIIAEESNNLQNLPPKSRVTNFTSKKPIKKAVLKRPVPQSSNRARVQKPKQGNKKVAGKSKDKTSTRPLTAYTLWCRENRKRVVAECPDLNFSSINKKMGVLWQALSDKDKMAWKRKAKKNAMKGSGLISTGKPNDQSVKALNSSPTLSDDVLRGSFDGNRTVGTTPIDVAAYLKLLGESLSIIGQRLTEHEGQIAVSGSLSVLLDSTLCALAPLLCLTSEAPELNGCTQETLSQILDNIAFFMPGL